VAGLVAVYYYALLRSTLKGSFDLMAMFFEHFLKRLPETLFYRNENGLDRPAWHAADAISMDVVTRQRVFVSDLKVVAVAGLLHSLGMPTLTVGLEDLNFPGVRELYLPILAELADYDATASSPI